MKNINSHCIGEQLGLPGIEERADRWFKVSLPTGVLAVRSEFELLEKTLLNGLDADFRPGQRYGDTFGVELAPGELTSDQIVCITGTSSRVFESQTRSDESVVYLADSTHDVPYRRMMDFL